jgi:O-antigen ligase
MSFQTTDYGETADQDVESRLVMWKQSIVMFAESPIIGHGLLSFRYGHWRNPHNQHLNILVQGGIIGYGLFIWVFIGAFREANYLARFGKGQFSRSMGQGLCAAIISLFIANLFGDRWSYYLITGYFWILMGIIHVLIIRKMPVIQKESEMLISEK